MVVMVPPHSHAAFALQYLLKDNAMPDFLKLTAYAFLALMGLSAWRAGVDGWRYYFGICLFIVCILRILMILRNRMTAKRNTRGNASAMAGADNADDTPAQPPAENNARHERPDAD